MNWSSSKTSLWNSSLAEPIDYTKIISGLSKPVEDAFKNIPIQKPAMNAQKQAREVADIQARSCNVMIYNCLRLSVEDAAKDVASTYLMTCDVPSIEQYYQKVVDDAFVKTSEVGILCSLYMR